MTFWLLAILSLFVQESVTTAIVMHEGYKNHHNLLVFTLIFFSASFLEIFYFHYLGKSLRVKRNSQAFLWAKKYIAKADYFIGSRGKRIFLILLAASVFPPSLTAFISAWLELPFKQKLFYIMIGNVLWYITSWMVVLGISFLISDERISLLVLLIVSLTIVVIQRTVSKYISQTSK